MKKHQGTTDEQKWRVNVNKQEDSEPSMEIQALCQPTVKLSYGADPEAWEYNLRDFRLLLLHRRELLVFNLGMCQRTFLEEIIASSICLQVRISALQVVLTNPLILRFGYLYSLSIHFI